VQYGGIITQCVVHQCIRISSIWAAVIRWLLQPWERLQSIVMNASVCLSDRISLELHMRSLPNFLCMFPTAMARSSSGALMIGGIAYRQKGVMAPFTMHCNTIAASKVVPLHDGPFGAAGGWWEHTARQTESIVPSLLCRCKWYWPGRGWRECTARAKCNQRLPCCQMSWIDWSKTLPLVLYATRWFIVSRPLCWNWYTALPINIISLQKNCAGTTLIPWPSSDRILHYGAFRDYAVLTEVVAKRI